MKRIFTFCTLALMSIAVFSFRCTFSQMSSPNTVIRTNYFDSTNFRLAESDTNKFSSNLLKAVLEKIDRRDNPRCLLVETVSPQYPIRDYELYDYRSESYYTASDSGEIVFQKVKDTLSESVNKIRLLKDRDSMLLRRHAKTVSDGPLLNDFSFVIANFIDIDKQDVKIKSFYLLTLPAGTLK